MTIKTLVWAINNLQDYHIREFSKLIDTASVFNVDLSYMGIGTEYKNLKQKIEILYEYLNSIEYDENTIILCIDGLDTLFNSDITTIKNKFLEKNTRILFSAEKIFTYQWNEYKSNYDNLPYEYKYLNSGTFIGYITDIKVMLTEILQYKRFSETQIDQGLYGIWVSDNLKFPNKVQMDGNCDIFWVTSKDWEYIRTAKTLTNPFTNTLPCIIHNTGNRHPNNFLAYQNAYNIILNQPLDK
jgi:hypothetical protein